MLLTGCTATPAPTVISQPPTPAIIPGELQSPSPTAAEPSPTSGPVIRATVPAAGCAERGRVQHDIVPEDGFGRELPFSIYLPPCYASTASGVPTLYLLHGLAADDAQWPRLGIAQAADHLILDLGSTPFLIVMPWQRTGLDSEAAIVEGLLPYVESHYHALPGPTWRAIGGLSRGAGWAFRIGFSHPGQFSAIGLHSPALLNGDLVALERWLGKAGRAHVPRLWIDIGDRDTLLGSTEQLLARLDELDVPYEYHPGTGWHDEAYWGSRVPEYLAWYAARW